MKLWLVDVVPDHVVRRRYCAYKYSVFLLFIDHFSYFFFFNLTMTELSEKRKLEDDNGVAAEAGQLIAVEQPTSKRAR